MLKVDSHRQKQLFPSVLRNIKMSDTMSLNTKLERRGAFTALMTPFGVRQVHFAAFISSSIGARFLFVGPKNGRPLVSYLLPWHGQSHDFSTGFH